MTRTILLVVAVLLFLSVFGVLIYRIHRDSKQNDKPGDSTLFNSAREVVTRYIRERDIALEKLKQSDLARADWKVYAMQAETAYKNQIKELKRQLRAVNTSGATVPELDSIQLSLYGPAPNDSTHTIPLDYSRKLTGDALRLPIEQRMATLSAERLDSATAHYGRMEASYEIDIHDLKQTIESASQAVDSLGSIAGKMQGVIDKQAKQLDNPWSFGIHAGYGATLSGGQVYMGPQAGASVQYKIRLKNRKR